MSKYKRLERLIKINTLIRANMGTARSKCGSALRSAFYEDDLAKHGHTNTTSSKTMGNSLEASLTTI